MKRKFQSEPGAHTGGWGGAKAGRRGWEETPQGANHKDGQDQAENRGDDNGGAFLMLS